MKLIKRISEPVALVLLVGGVAYLAVTVDRAFVRGKVVSTVHHVPCIWCSETLQPSLVESSKAPAEGSPIARGAVSGRRVR